MEQYLNSASNSIKNLFTNLTGKFKSSFVKPVLQKGTYEKINKDLENFFIRENMAQAISKQEEFANQIILMEGILYDKLHGNLIMQLKDSCDANDVECLENNLNDAAEKYKNEILFTFIVLNRMMGRPDSEFIAPDENARILFLIELLCSNQPIEYRTSVSEDLHTLLQRYCDFPSKIEPTLSESVQPLNKKQRLAVPGGPSTRYVPGLPPQTFNVVPPEPPQKNIWQPSGGKKGKKSRRKSKRRQGKKIKRKTVKRRVSKKRIYKK